MKKSCPGIPVLFFLCSFFLSVSGLFSTEPMENPFGIMISGVGVEKRLEIARNLGVTLYRPGVAIFTETWNGRNEECEAALKAGLKLVLTVRNGKGPGKPCTPPANIAEYKKTLGQILEKYHPEVLAIENEENSQQLFYSGSPEDYLKQLKAAVDVARQHGVKCTNGGLVCRLVALLMAEKYREEGNVMKAEEILKQALDERKYRKALNTPLAKSQIARGRTLLAGYKTTGIDFVNFHWYIPNAFLLKEAIAFMRQSTDLPVILNELGQQKSTDPAEVETLMNVIVQEKVPLAVWFSTDINAFAEARGLIESDGTLRPNGIRFQKFLQTHFGVGK
ncbi:MAG: hypothetical protein HQM10_13520 [Candidatus Riflebacteria bacterium]|nr:hypothetical protein [Candidatus Riflebacteria bacterium]